MAATNAVTVARIRITAFLTVKAVVMVVVQLSCEHCWLPRANMLTSQAPSQMPAICTSSYPHPTASNAL